MDLLIVREGTSWKGLSIINPSESTLNQPLEFVRGFGNGQLDGRCLVAHSDGLETSQSGFKHTPDVIVFRFVAIGITEVRLDSCNPITKSADRSFDAGVNKGDDIITALNVIVRINLNQQAATSLPRTCLA